MKVSFVMNSFGSFVFFFAVSLVDELQLRQSLLSQSKAFSDVIERKIPPVSKATKLAVSQSLLSQSKAFSDVIERKIPPVSKATKLTKESNIEKMTLSSSTKFNNLPFQVGFMNPLNF